MPNPLPLRSPSPLSRVRSETALVKNATTDILSSIEWLENFYGDGHDVHIVATSGAMSEPSQQTPIDPDHLFLSMLRQRLLEDILFLYNPQKQQFHTVVALGSDVAGHPRITHGGFTSALIDETTGGLVYEMKKAGLLGEGPAFTARLEVDFKKPLPVGTVVICTAKLMSIEGRKCWVEAEMLDEPGGMVYATGKALYVTPKQQQQE